MDKTLKDASRVNDKDYICFPIDCKIKKGEISFFSRKDGEMNKRKPH